MPYPFNAVATGDTYSDAGTCAFPRPTNAFALQVYSNAIYYTLLLVPKDQRQVGGYTPDVVEHFLGPSMSNFSEADLPAGQQFAGIQVRSAVAGTPAVVTVI